MSKDIDLINIAIDKKVRNKLKFLKNILENYEEKNIQYFHSNML